jgi:hypothetical protein
LYCWVRKKETKGVVRIRHCRAADRKQVLPILFNPAVIVHAEGKRGRSRQ